MCTELCVATIFQGAAAAGYGPEADGQKTPLRVPVHMTAFGLGGGTVSGTTVKIMIMVDVGLFFAQQYIPTLSDHCKDFQQYIFG